MNYLLVFIGGGLGSACRLFISSVINQHLRVIFPFGTFSVNVAGSFLIGFFFYLFQNLVVPVEIRILLTIGFLGGFTTFSSFSLETINLLRDGEYRLFLYNILLTNAACLIFTVMGIYLAKIALNQTVRHI